MIAVTCTLRGVINAGGGESWRGNRRDGVSQEKARGLNYNVPVHESLPPNESSAPIVYLIQMNHI